MITLQGHDFILKDTHISTQIMYNNTAHNHSHDFYEFFYVISGAVSHTSQKQTEVLSAGDLRFMSIGSRHELKPIKNSVQRDVLIDRAFFEGICQLLFMNEKLLTENFHKKKVRLSITEVTEFERILTDFSKQANVQKKQCIALELVAKFMSKFHDSLTSSDEGTSYPDVIKKILASLSTPENLGKKVNTLISRFGYSPIYISRLFKRYVGVTISDYMKDVRLSHAAYYLENTNYSLQQICNLVGLDNLSYLNKIFKQKYGTTPIKYRKLNNKDSINPLAKAKKHELEPLKDSKHEQSGPRKIEDFED